ncbi:hypothetical protein [Virgibacillus sp. YIM 98842]|uniref:hypothetical protein n=1 Tax=Virgibacillus sp. YIM 98842 TaxID=2663533 RepID=UPI0013DD616B|nr:hypothetical protein [Virgibacillus sp. YIM 98842]
MTKIKSLKVINTTDENGYSFGYEVGQQGVEKIIDATLEFPDSVSRMYMVYGPKENLIASIEDAPVVIEYFKQK